MIGILQLFLFIYASDMKNLKYYENPLTDVKNRPGKTIDKIFENTMETCVRAQVLSNV